MKKAPTIDILEYEILNDIDDFKQRNQLKRNEEKINGRNRKKYSRINR